MFKYGFIIIIVALVIVSGCVTSDVPVTNYTVIQPTVSQNGIISQKNMDYADYVNDIETAGLERERRDAFKATNYSVCNENKTALYSEGGVDQYCTEIITLKYGYFDNLERKCREQDNIQYLYHCYGMRNNQSFDTPISVRIVNPSGDEIQNISFIKPQRCYENETGYDGSDLVMHFTCEN